MSRQREYVKKVPIARGFLWIIIIGSLYSSVASRRDKPVTPIAQNECANIVALRKSQKQRCSSSGGFMHDGSVVRTLVARPSSPSHTLTPFTHSPCFNPPSPRPARFRCIRFRFHRRCTHVQARSSTPPAPLPPIIPSSRCYFFFSLPRDTPRRDRKLPIRVVARFRIGGIKLQFRSAGKRKEDEKENARDSARVNMRDACTTDARDASLVRTYVWILIRYTDCHKILRRTDSLSIRRSAFLRQMEFSRLALDR